MSRTLPLISIISVNYNEAFATRKMLDSVRDNTYPNIEVIVVDNGSTKPGFEDLEKEYPDFHFFSSKTNLGFAGGNNLGFEKSSGEFLFFLNNDAVLTPGCLEKLVEKFEQNSNLGIISPIILNAKTSENEPDIIQFAGATAVNKLTGRNRTIGAGDVFYKNYTPDFPTEYVHGCAMMIPRRVIEKAGLIPEPYFLYYEELDWCERIREAGFEIGPVVLEATVYHEESLSIGQDSPLKTYYLNRSRILFMRRNTRAHELLGFFLFLIIFTIPKNTLNFALNRQFSNISALWRAFAWNVKDMFKSDYPHTTPLQNIDKKSVRPQVN